MANGLVDELFTIEEVSARDESGIDIVIFDPERTMRFLLKILQLEEKAKAGKLRFAITGDGAAIYNY